MFRFPLHFPVTTVHILKEAYSNNKMQSYIKKTQSKQFQKIRQNKLTHNTNLKDKKSIGTITFSESFELVVDAKASGPP